MIIYRMLVRGVEEVKSHLLPTADKWNTEYLLRMCGSVTSNLTRYMMEGEHLIMDKNDLKEYLDIVIDLESSVQLQEETIVHLKNEIAQLNNTRIDVVKPVLPQTRSSGKKNVRLGCFFLLVGIPSLISWYLYVVKHIHMMSFFSSVLALIIGGFCTWVGSGCLYEGVFQAASDREYNERSERDYFAALAKYESDVKQSELLTKQNNIRISAYEHELDIMERCLGETKNTMERVYSANIIWYKYRNLPMLCSIYEYIVSGRTDSLDGKDGAYNMLELEMRLDKLITQMDKVLAKLEAIRTNQYMLYSVVNEFNDKMNTLLCETQRLSQETLSLTQTVSEKSEKLVNRIEDLNKKSAIAAYYNQRTATELHYLNRMNYLTGRNDAVFFNVPPTD